MEHPVSYRKKNTMKGCVGTSFRSSSRRSRYLARPRTGSSQGTFCPNPNGQGTRHPCPKPSKGVQFLDPAYHHLHNDLPRHISLSFYLPVALSFYLSVALSLLIIATQCFAPLDFRSHSPRPPSKQTQWEDQTHGHTADR